MTVGLLLVLLAAVLAGSVHGAYGHGVGFEALPPQSLRGQMVFIEINAPNAADPETDQQFVFQMMEDKTREPITDVTYEIEASKQGAVLFHDTFRSGSGTLTIDLVDADAGGVRIEKQASGIFGFISGDTDVARVTGPHFDYGGLYHFVIRIHTAGSPDRLDPPLEWNAGISIADTTQYVINDPHFGEQSLYHITYYDLIENFEYDPRTASITFEMPFDGSFDSINQTSVVHEEVMFSKEFGDLMVSNITVAVDGVVMPEDIIQIDDFVEKYRVVHLTMFTDNILELYDQGKLEDNRMSFVFAPSEGGLPLATVTKNGQFRIIMDTVPKNARSGQELEIRYRLVDAFLKDRPAAVDYDMYVLQGERMLFYAGGISSDKPGVFDSAKVSVPDDVTGVIYVHFENLKGNTLASARLPIVIDRAGEDSGVKVPAWIRSNAGWWSEGLISDGEFVSAMEFLIEEGIISVSASGVPGSHASGVPGWIRSNAGWWSEGLISDGEFVSAMECLIEEGIIRV